MAQDQNNPMSSLSRFKLLSKYSSTFTENFTRLQIKQTHVQKQQITGYLYNYFQAKVNRKILQNIVHFL